MDERVLFRDGDPWRDLTPEVHRLRAATVVTSSGTAHLLNRQTGWRCRLPLEGGHVLPYDDRWVKMSALSLTPCGLVVHHRRFWLRGTRVRLVLAGLVPNWIHTAAGRATVEAVLAGREPDSPGHPPAPCEAAYCTVAGADLA